ncbi:glutathione peroxidase [Rubrivivax sp. RP6-9]|uniref:glutathione peroxidase n=1 Tax=Rubrivivax sp. RP6-9 TaxID=3415750 RepID=UPI003CC53C4A
MTTHPARLLVVCAALLATSASATPPAGPSGPAAACPALLQHTVPRLQDEKPVPLCRFAGQVVVVVNTASKCGYTPQYKSLETLHTRYKDRGLVVLGFPSGDFGGQELASNAAIADFCESTFGVRFPMFAKTSVKGSAAHPLYKTLAARTGRAPGWNFHKYIVGRDGQTVVSHGSDTDPLDAAFLKDVDRLLSAK